VRFIGYSFEAEPIHAEIAMEQEIDVMMLQYNLLDEACAKVFATASSKGIGILVGGPFKRGYLSGQYDNIEDLPIDDNYWAWNLRYAKQKVEELLATATRLKKHAGGALELRRMALHHILRHQGVTSAIVGHRTESEVTENANIINNISYDIY